MNLPIIRLKLLQWLHGALLVTVFVLITVAAVCCGVFWQSWPALHMEVQNCLATPLCVSVAVGLTMLVVMLLLVLRHHHAIAVVWPLLLAPVVFFWLMAAGEKFCWSSLTGVLCCFVAFLVIWAPVLKTYKLPYVAAMPDKLGRRLLYMRTGSRIRYLLSHAGYHGVTVAVTGPWGSGKSHFINYLCYTLQKPYRGNEPFMEESFCGRFTICSVDLWRCADKDAMWNDIATALASAVSGRNVQLYNKCRTFLVDFLQMLHVPAVSLADAILQVVSTGVEGRASGEAVLESRINFPRHAFVLVLDNLDRCDRSKICALFPLIQRLRQIRGLVTICGIAQEELARYNTPDEAQPQNLSGTYLKIFDLLLPLPRISARYASAFLEKLVDRQKMDCPNVRRWVKEQRLVFDTPRQMENIINQLCVIDNCYLSRFYEEKDTDESLQQKKRIHASFYVAALRVAYPYAAAILEKQETPLEFLKLVTEPPRDMRSAAPASLASSAQLFLRTDNATTDFRLLYSLVEELVRCSSEDLLFALHQEYLHISALTEDECRRVMEYCMHKKVNPLSALKAVFPNEYMEEEEAPLYRSVLESAFRSVRKAASFHYICRSVQDDVLAPNAIYADMLRLPDLLLALIDCVMRNERPVGMNLSQSKELQALQEQVMRRMEVAPLAATLESIGACAHAAAYKDSAIVRTNAPYLYQQLRQGEDSLGSNLWMKLNGIVLRYVNVVCSHILEGTIDSRDVVQSLGEQLAPYHNEIIQTVEQFCRSRRALKWKSLELRVRGNYLIDALFRPSLNKSIMARSECCTYPYTWIWLTLRKELLPEGFPHACIERIQLRDEQSRAQSREITESPVALHPLTYGQRVHCADQLIHDIITHDNGSSPFFER